MDGIRFASKRESEVYQVLKITESVGMISGLRLQPRYELQAKFTDGAGVNHRAVCYVADFEFTRVDKLVAVDVKGAPTAEFRLKWKMAIKKYPEVVFEIWK